jgi:hypothetical protein
MTGWPKMYFNNRYSEEYYINEEKQLVNIAHMLEAFKEIAAILDTCDPEERRRIIKSVQVLFEIE